MLAHAGSADKSLSLVMAFIGIWIGWAGWSRLRGNGFPRMPRPVAIACVVVAAGFLISATFVPRAILGPTSTSPSSVARIPSTARIAVTRPLDGATVSGDRLDVIVVLTGGTIVQTTTTAIKRDKGHLHLSIDGRLASMTYGTVQILSIGDLAPGPHTLTAEFVASDHAPFDPRVIATVTFTKAAS